MGREKLKENRRNFKKPIIKSNPAGIELSLPGKVGISC
jgi:hypothetical protein